MNPIALIAIKPLAWFQVDGMAAEAGQDQHGVAAVYDLWSALTAWG